MVTNPAVGPTCKHKLTKKIHFFFHAINRSVWHCCRWDSVTRSGDLHKVLKSLKAKFQRTASFQNVCVLSLRMPVAQIRGEHVAPVQHEASLRNGDVGPAVWRPPAPLCLRAAVPVGCRT